jgi:hypothetical protein
MFSHFFRLMRWHVFRLQRLGPAEEAQEDKDEEQVEDEQGETKEVEENKNKKKHELPFSSLSPTPPPPQEFPVLLRMGHGHASFVARHHCDAHHVQSLLTSEPILSALARVSCFSSTTTRVESHKSFTTVFL